MSRSVPQIRCDISTGRVDTGLRDCWAVPSKFQKNNTKPAVIFLYGNGGNGLDLLAQAASNVGSASSVLMSAVAEYLPVFGCDYGVGTGSTTQLAHMGNTNALNKLSTHITWIQGSGGGAKVGKVIFVGISMGWFLATKFNYNNPTLVAGRLGFLGGSDLTDIYTNDRGSARATVGTAYNVTYPAALPAGADPNLLDYTGHTMSPGINYAANDDATVLISTVTSLAAKTGDTVVNLGNSGGHSQQSIAQINPDDFVKKVLQYAEAA